MNEPKPKPYDDPAPLDEIELWEPDVHENVGNPEDDLSQWLGEGCRRVFDPGQLR